MLGTILIVILILALLGALPRWLTIENTCFVSRSLPNLIGPDSPS